MRMTNAGRNIVKMAVMKTNEMNQDRMEMNDEDVINMKRITMENKDEENAMIIMKKNMTVSFFR
ncbi:hypothetical protein [Hungatella hathewayi]